MPTDLERDLSEADQGDDDAPVLVQRKIVDDTEMDITPMIDITFLLLIFFLVASVPDPQVAVDLPRAVMGGKVDPQVSSVITIAVNPANADDALVFLADGRRPEAQVLGKNAQKEAIPLALNNAIAAGKPFVIIKAEKDVRNGEVNRIMDIVATVVGIQPYLAVFEDDQ